LQQVARPVRTLALKHRVNSGCHLCAQTTRLGARRQVLLHVAVGDHQVANVMSDIEARSIGASTAELPARSDDKTPLFGIPRITTFPFKGSAAIVYWDDGNQTPLPPVTNTPPPPASGADPHSFPRKTPAARQQKSDWLSPTGSLTDVCGGLPCRTFNFSG
jgi:hypothetical protein